MMQNGALGVFFSPPISRFMTTPSLTESPVGCLGASMQPSRELFAHQRGSLTLLPLAWHGLEAYVAYFLGLVLPRFSHFGHFWPIFWATFVVVCS